MNIHVFHGIAVATAIFASAYIVQADTRIAGDVFSDAVFWYSGATDVGNDTFFHTGDVRDVRCFGDASHALNKSSRFGAGTSPTVITNMPVVHPHAWVTNADETCVYFRQPVDYSLADPKISPAGIKLPQLFSFGYKTNMTVVARIRWEGPTRSGGSSYLFGIGRKGGKGGFQVGISSVGGLIAYINAGGGAETLYFSRDESVAIHSNQWVDLAFTVANDKITTYRAQESYGSGYWYKNVQNLPNHAKLDVTNVVNEFTFGTGGTGIPDGARTYSAYKSAWAVFRGQFAELAIWNRELSEGEIAEAFGSSTAKLRFGVSDGSGGEFAGTAVSGQAVKPQDWRGFSAVLSKEKPSLSVEFPIEAHEVELSQVLSILSTESSASGKVEIKINGETVSTKYVNAGVLRRIYIPGRFFKRNDNTLTLKWLGEGEFKLDSLVIGGAWQLGYADSKIDEFCKRNRYRTTFNICGSQVWATRLNRGVESAANYDFLKIVFPMTSGSAKGEHTLTIPLLCTTTGTNPLELQITVNGTVKTVFSVSSHSYSEPDVLKLELADGELVTGENTIELRIVDKTSSHGIAFDYIRLESAAFRDTFGITVR
jgi:hypothetical protein